MSRRRRMGWGNAADEWQRASEEWRATATNWQAVAERWERISGDWQERALAAERKLRNAPQTAARPRQGGGASGP